MKSQIRVGLVFGIYLTALLNDTGYSQALANAEVPGDHFSLEGALELFKTSSSPEEFERLLNVPDGKVNNLDLNGDGLTDYIRVIDRYDGNVHAFILQAVISSTESQDVAVIELEQLGDGKARLQIVGDPDIYGVETIMEPTQEVRTYAGTQTARSTVNVWSWPCVQYVWNPYYSVWVSPWGWNSRPAWWYPWRPVSYVVYRPYWNPYTSYYSQCYYHRNIYAHRVYMPLRTTSVVVYDRNRDVIMHSRNTRGRDYDLDRDGRYKDTGSTRRDREMVDGSGRSDRSTDDHSRRSYQDSRASDNGSTHSNGRGRTAQRDYTQGTPRSNNQESFSAPRRTQDNTSRSYSQLSDNKNSEHQRTTVRTPQHRSSDNHARSTVTTSQPGNSGIHNRPTGGGAAISHQPSHSPARVSPSPSRGGHSGGAGSAPSHKRGRD
jgi:hypothetical protein